MGKAKLYFKKKYMNGIINTKIFKQGFDILAENDFNPDLVLLFGTDIYDAGLKFGIPIGIFGTLAIIRICLFINEKINGITYRKMFKPIKRD